MLKRITVFAALVALVFALFAIMKRKSFTSKDKEVVEIPVARAVLPQAEPPLAIIESPARPLIADEAIVQIDEIDRFFSFGDDKFPIVETVTFKSHVDWMVTRQAWLVDYASHYKTSRHFIARSLNQQPDYFTQKVSIGDRFNILKPDQEIRFLLRADLSRLKLWFYYIAGDTAPYLVKIYDIGAGKIDEAKGCLTPAGRFTLAERVAIYKPGLEGYFHGERVELIRVFGTRWIPFDNAGHGLHGAPWQVDPITHALAEDITKVGTYSSEGGICLKSADIEELYAIVISRPTTLEILPYGR